MNEGTLQVSPGVAPSSQDEAEAFVARTVAEQYSEARSALRNRHSVFFVPVQYIGAVGLAGAVVAFVYAVINALV